MPTLARAVGTLTFLAARNRPGTTASMMIAARPPLGAMLHGAMGPRPRRPQNDSEQHADRGPISRPPAPRDVPRHPEGDVRTEP